MGAGPRGREGHAGARPALSLVCKRGQALNSLFLRGIMKLRAKVEDNDNKTVSDRGGADAAGRAADGGTAVILGTPRASWVLPTPGTAPPRGLRSAVTASC